MRTIAIVALLFATVDGHRHHHHKSAIISSKGGPDKKKDKFQAWEDGEFVGPNEYKRHVPEQFDGPGDDRLMWSIIKQYAFEARDKKTGDPTGHFYLDYAGAMALAREVAETHLKLKGGELDSYIKEHGADTWARFDVNDDGAIDAERGATFARMIVGNVEAGIGLQMQKSSKQIAQKPVQNLQLADNEADPAFLAGKAVAADVVAKQQAFEKAKTADVETRNDKDSKECSDLRKHVVTTHETRLKSFDPNVQMVYIPEQEIYLGLY